MQLAPDWVSTAPSAMIEKDSMNIFWTLQIKLKTEHKFTKIQFLAFVPKLKSLIDWFSYRTIIIDEHLSSKAMLTNDSMNSRSPKTITF